MFCCLFSVHEPSGRKIPRSAEPHLLIPANQPPTGTHQVLPVGTAIQVTGEEKHMPAILPYLNSDSECWIHATLHQVVEEGPRSSKTLAEVRIDGKPVGRLTPKMSSDLLPAVSHLAELGQTMCVRAIAKGNRLKAEVVLYALRAHELPAEWFNAVTTPPPLPPADWYADPHHVARLRYWDGTRWTEHTAP
jgi:Protein of unknown function (DUF2510)